MEISLRPPIDPTHEGVEREGQRGEGQRGQQKGRLGIRRQDECFSCVYLEIRSRRQASFVRFSIIEEQRAGVFVRF